MKNSVLVTGAGGFIGSHLAERLVELGYQTRALVRYNSKNNWGWLENSDYKKEIEIVRGDVRDYDSVLSAMQGMETVFHLAALIGIPYSYESPLAYIRTNIEGTYNVLQAARHYSVENILITSTSETYGSAQYIPIDEKHPTVAQSPYAATKIAADELALSFYRSFDLPVKVARPFNTYGPRQSARAIIPTIIAQILYGEKVSLGNLSPSRDFTYVSDTVEGFIEIFKSGKCLGEVTNIGMNKEISMKDLLFVIAKIMAKDVQAEESNERIRPANSEVDRLLCCNTKIIGATAWRPKYNMESGLVKTVEWFRNNIDLYKAEIYNV